MLESDLGYILANFSFLSQSVTKLENTTNFVSERMKEMNDIKIKLIACGSVWV
jgi:hypothetical protein